MLSIVVEGEGEDPDNRSHWSFAFRHAGAARGNILQVLVIDRERLWYQFDRRDDITILSPSVEGIFEIATIPPSRYAQTIRVVSNEPAPRNGKDRCQDWTLNCILALEVEELIPDGTSAWIDGLVGKSAAQLAQALGRRWVAHARR